jgi:hypothetical protein
MLPFRYQNMRLEERKVLADQIRRSGGSARRGGAWSKRRRRPPLKSDRLDIDDAKFASVGIVPGAHRPSKVA